MEKRKEGGERETRSHVESACSRGGSKFLLGQSGIGTVAVAAARGGSGAGVLLGGLELFVRGLQDQEVVLPGVIATGTAPAAAQVTGGAPGRQFRGGVLPRSAVRSATDAAAAARRIAGVDRRGRGATVLVLQLALDAHRLHVGKFEHRLVQIVDEPGAVVLVRMVERGQHGAVETGFDLHPVRIVCKARKERGVRESWQQRFMEQSETGRGHDGRTQRQTKEGGRKEELLHYM